MSVVWQRQERVTPPLHGVPGPATPNPGTLEAGGKGLRVETPQGEVVEGEGYGGGAGVSGGYAGRALVVDLSSESA